MRLNSSIETSLSYRVVFDNFQASIFFNEPHRPKLHPFLRLAGKHFSMELCILYKYIYILYIYSLLNLDIATQQNGPSHLWVKTWPKCCIHPTNRWLYGIEARDDYSIYVVLSSIYSLESYYVYEGKHHHFSNAYISNYWPSHIDDCKDRATPWDLLNFRWFFLSASVFVPSKQQVLGHDLYLLSHNLCDRSSHRRFLLPEAPHESNLAPKRLQWLQESLSKQWNSLHINWFAGFIASTDMFLSFRMWIWHFGGMVWQILQPWWCTCGIDSMCTQLLCSNWLLQPVVILPVL